MEGDFIDEVGRKFGYDAELINALKRCIPAMIEGKSDEEIELLKNTLSRVQIYTFDKRPTQKEVEDITSEKVNGRNNHVTTIECDKGEYDRGTPYGGYVNQPIFDENMNIVDRVGFIYLTNLDEGSSTAEFYGTRINLSHLIHELGHAWSAQKGEYEQEENGNFTMRVGTARFKHRVDRINHTVEEVSVKGLYVEEALNSIEEEDTLFKMFDIESYHDIPGYIPSDYQGIMTSMMRHYKDKLGEDIFQKMRLLKEDDGIERFQKYFDQTEFMKRMSDPEYYVEKEKELASAQETSMSDGAKKRIRDFFEKYRRIYLTTQNNNNFIESLDSTMEQIFSFMSIRYSYDIMQEDGMEAYRRTQIAMMSEGYKPVNEASEMIEEKEQDNIDNTLETIEIDSSVDDEKAIEDNRKPIKEEDRDI